MKHRSAIYLALALALTFSLVTACAQPTPTPQPAPTKAAAATSVPATVAPTAVPATATPAGPKLGSAQRPIQLYFVPSVDVNVIVTSGKKIADFLKAQTGLEFEVKVPTSYAATIEAMGVAKGDAMGFIPALPYVLAQQKYGVTVGLAVVRNGLSWYATEYLVRADSGLKSLKDLEGKKWAVPSVTSTSGYLYPKAQLTREKINPGAMVEAGGHPQAVLAVLNKQVDFATVFFSPPGDAGQWKWGDKPEPDGKSRIETVSGKKQAFIGDFIIRDARANVIEQYPDVCDQVKIIGLSDQIPNDTVSFVKDFPQDLKDKIMDGLIAYSKSDEGKTVLANKDFYDITGFEKVKDSFYDPVRNFITMLGIKEDEILKKK
jgi:phosphonate transport system substrate-binding protein